MPWKSGKTTDPNAGSDAGKPCGNTAEPCPCNPSVTIARVIRGNPYVASNAPAAGMPDSVPPTKTYQVQVTVTPAMAACPGHHIDLSIVNTSAENGTATVSPAQITGTTVVTVTGGNQTMPGHDGQLKIQAKLDGAAVKAESAGFSVCAHPVNYTDTYVSDIDRPRQVGMVVQDGWDSDSGTLADMSEAKISELVDGDKPDSPPFSGDGSSNNSDYLAADQLSQDTHTIGRPRAGPKATQEFRQLCIFKCGRCGVTDKIHPNSGFKILHDVFLDGAQWKHHVRKLGAAVTVKGFSSGAGTATAASPDHNLP